MGAECVFPRWVANHFFRTGTTTTIPVLAMILLFSGAKFFARKAKYQSHGERLNNLKKKAASLYEWTLVISYTMLPPSLNQETNGFTQKNTPFHGNVRENAVNQVENAFHYLFHVKTHTLFPLKSDADFLS